MTTLRVIGQPLLIALVLALGVRSAVRIYSIPSPSMEPALQAGDHIVVTPYHSALPARGDIVVFHSPVTRDQLLVKRIVAVPGDLVESRGGRLFVSGREGGEGLAIVPQIIPAGCYFVMGDNRGNSFDSRNWGVLPGAQIVGRARFVLWSSGRGSMGPRANAAPRQRPALPDGPLRLDRLFKSIQ
jgi:signal peptidase I